MTNNQKFERCVKVWVWHNWTDRKPCRGIVMGVKPNGNIIISYSHPNGIGEVTGREFTPKELEARVKIMERKDYLANP